MSRLIRVQQESQVWDDLGFSETLDSVLQLINVIRIISMTQENKEKTEAFAEPLITIQRRLMVLRK